MLNRRRFLQGIVAAAATPPFVHGCAEDRRFPRNGLLPEHEVERWLTTQHVAMADGTFFASCNYYTYLARRV